MLIAASNATARAALESLVRRSGAGEVVSSTASPEQWLALARDRHPDLVVSDSPEAATGGAPVLVVAPDPAALEEGVHGSLPSDATPEELAAALRAIEAGLRVYHPAALERVEAAALTPVLSPREIEVLNMVAEGIGNKIIAGRLGITENTVKFHVSSIMEKLDAGSRTEAVTRGIRQGLLII